jgi:hypothetical protein
MISRLPERAKFRTYHLLDEEQPFELVKSIIMCIALILYCLGGGEPKPLCIKSFLYNEYYGKNICKTERYNLLILSNLLTLDGIIYALDRGLVVNHGQIADTVDTGRIPRPLIVRLCACIHAAT